MAQPPRAIGKVWSTRFSGWQEGVEKLCGAADLAGAISNGRTVLIKPNLVEALAPPITTPVALVEAIVRFLQERVPAARLIVGEGCGSTDYTTSHCFDLLGYQEMAARLHIELLDLNPLASVEKANPDCRRWPRMYLPALLDEVFLISVPVLKAHSLSRVTLTMKNMMGCAPPAHYQHGGHWGKSAFHENIQEAVLDLNRYRTPDFTLLDATIGMARAHLWGPQCDPPVGRLASGWDPVGIDR